MLFFHLIIWPTSTYSMYPFGNKGDLVGEYMNLCPFLATISPNVIGSLGNYLSHVFNFPKFKHFNSLCTAVLANDCTTVGTDRQTDIKTWPPQLLLHGTCSMSLFHPNFLSWICSDKHRTAKSIESNYLPANRLQDDRGQWRLRCYDRILSEERSFIMLNIWISIINTWQTPACFGCFITLTCNNASSKSDLFL